MTDEIRLRIDISIDDGKTWPGVTGRIWTAHGSLIVSDDSIRTVREDLFDFLQAQHPEWNWYNYPPDVLKIPAFVLNPADPYIIPFASSGGPGATLWHFDLVMVVSRANPEAALTRLEFFFTEITADLLGYPSVRWDPFTIDGTTEISGIDHLTATLTVMVADSPNGGT